MLPSCSVPTMTYLLPFCEFATPAIYHASNAALRHVDHVQGKFLEEMQVGAREALLVHNLAPLATRRDIAMLGALQECRLGWQIVPTTFLLRGNCYVKPRLQQRFRSVHLRILPVHNTLPYHVVNAACRFYKACCQTWSSEPARPARSTGPSFFFLRLDAPRSTLKDCLSEVR